MEINHTTRALAIVGAILFLTLVVIGSVHPAAVAWPSSSAPTSATDQPRPAVHAERSARYEGKRNVDYRAGRWYYRGEELSAPGTCTTEDSCEVRVQPDGRPFAVYVWPPGVHP